MKYYTSDIHFGHNKIIDFEKRPFKSIEEMDSKIINNWNNKVKPTDEVYILGDFAFYKGEKTNEILKQLNGTKYLIVGNHDCYFLKDKSFDKTLFKWIENYKEIKDNKRKVVLFHYPIAVWNASHHGSYHLYGHIHRNIETSHPLRFDLGERALNVGMDVNNFTPMNLDELIQKTSFNTIESITTPSNVTNYPELKNIKEFLRKEKDLEKCENICVLTPKGWGKFKN